MINAKQVQSKPTLGVSLTGKSVASSPQDFILVFKNFLF